MAHPLKNAEMMNCMSDTIDFDERLYSVYDAARAKSEETLRYWTGQIARFIGKLDGPRTILDLGSGTGHFTPALAQAFGTATGIEPSDKMRTIAEQQHSAPGVTYLNGTAEEIPLPDSSCDAAWLSFVVHHLKDRVAAARELRRVLKQEGKVFIRMILREHLKEAVLFDFFPTALAADEARTPSLADVVSNFQAGGMRLMMHERHTETLASSLEEYFKRVSQRAVSTLVLISDEDFNTGLMSMKQRAELEAGQVLTETYDFLVFV